MKSPSTKPKPAAKPQPTPGVSVHDHVYFRHGDSPEHGRVLAVGAHGCTIDHGGAQRRVKWEQLLGHRKRFRPQTNVIDHGEDGAIVEDENGKRVFVAGLVPADEEMAKALKNAPGLALRDTTDKRGHQTKRWTRTSPKEKKGRARAKPDDGKRGSKAGYGTHNLQAGDKVSFAMGDVSGKGKIVATGKHGATVVDGKGRQHRVHWHEISGHEAAPGKDPHPGVLGEQKKTPADKFKASDYAKAHDKAEVSADDILSHFPADTKEKIAEVQQRLASIEQTIDQHKKDGRYTAQREVLHANIVASILSPERVKAATPAEGQKPTFTILGGRGGSGKSWFNGKVYDEKNSIVIDADNIKSLLPEYEGWNAFSVHEESSELFDYITDLARDLGLNIVHDATLKTTKKALATVNRFKAAGYRTEAHYMHLPRQEAAKRAVSRFLGKTQRYVPVDVVLGNTTNEASFDEVRKLVDGWSFRDNNVPQGAEPILISASDDSKGRGNHGGDLTKSEQAPIIIAWRK